MNLVQLRLIHFYLGVFFAPTILFFAFSGALQVFKLHESYRETPGASGDWIAWMAQVHKEQDLVAPRAAPAKAVRADAPARKPEVARPFRWFAASMGAALMVTTLLGLWIAFSYPRRRRGFLVALFAGFLIPILILQLGARL